MKKKTFSIALCIVLGLIQVQAENGKSGPRSTPSEKSVPVVHNILSNKLPAKLLTTIKKNYSSYWITSLYKETANGKISYHITVENPDQIIKLSASHPAANWTIRRVVPKDQAAS